MPQYPRLDNQEDTGSPVTIPYRYPMSQIPLVTEFENVIRAYYSLGICDGSASIFGACGRFISFYVFKKFTETYCFNTTIRWKTGCIFNMRYSNSVPVISVSKIPVMKFKKPVSIVMTAWPHQKGERK